MGTTDQGGSLPSALRPLSGAVVDDPLPTLAGRVRELETHELGEHPDVLEEVQQAIVTELERIGGWHLPEQALRGGERA